ncbi:hypothetical protein [Thalassovita aquimarina]|uniref:Uncharacterized protein n=1 Tax=Thalassovita aquimarina TaxID=2785917 RepID=A0ABS5HL11_9RHOB|nr:hypothetical protein [Thalassovita aquimarina]MBR9649667.1 hypothetical protein [Thalassovita aquimarina]
MSTEQPDTSEAIKIALAAADTASDAAVLAEDTSNMLSDKADWVDRKLIPAGIGGMIGIIICAGISAMVYYRTLGDLRTARDTHVEALHLFTQNVNQLKMAVETAHELIDGQSAERRAVMAALDGMNEKIDTLGLQLAETTAVTNAALGEGPEGFAGHLSTMLEPQIGGARDDVMAGISDLQLALSQKLNTLANQIIAAGPVTAPSTTRLSATAKPKPTPRIQQKPRTVIKPRSKPTTRSTTRTTASKSSSNPFSYP